MCTVINLFAGPGAGKSTTAAGLFYLMKLKGLNVELVTEYAKDIVYEEHLSRLEDQMYIFAKQQRRISRLKDKVDYIITDSPLPLSILYNKNLSENFNKVVMESFNSYENINVFIGRVKEYKEVSRTQTENQAKELDTELQILLKKLKISYFIIDGDKDASGFLLNYILSVPKENAIIKDKFGKEIKAGDLLSVQDISRLISVHEESNGTLYFTPYGTKELVKDYFSNDLIIWED